MLIKIYRAVTKLGPINSEADLLKAFGTSTGYAENLRHKRQKLRDWDREHNIPTPPEPIYSRESLGLYHQALSVSSSTLRYTHHPLLKN
jgi:hypothetical protein